MRAERDPISAAGYRADIDGMRAIAVTAVVAFHAGGARLVGSGFVGVDIFFVISGFLIGGIIYRAAAAREFSYAGFYARRARRILPALLAVIAATLAAGLVILTPAELRGIAGHASLAALGVSNFAFAQTVGYFDPGQALDPTLMTWSLGVEEQYYLLVPLLLIALVRWMPRHVLTGLVVLTGASLLVSVLWTRLEPHSAFFMLPTRAWELGAGMIVAVANAERRIAIGARMRELLGVAGLAVMLVSMFVYGAGTPFPGIAALLPVAGATTSILAGGSRANRLLLAAPPLVWVGRISYSWYLWHWVLLAFLQIVTAGAPRFAAIVGAVVLSFALAALSWRFVETPFRRIRLRGGRALAGYAGTIALTVASATALRLADGLPGRVGPQLATLDLELVNLACLADFGSDKPDLGPRCISPGEDRPAVALIGDSHANALAPALAEMARSRGWGYRMFGKVACQPLRGVVPRQYDMIQLGDECARFTETVLARVTEDPSIRVVLLGGFWRQRPPGLRASAVWPGNAEAHSSAELFESGLRATIAMLQSAGKRVYLVEDVAAFNSQPRNLLITHDMPLRGAMLRYLRVVRRDDAIVPRDPIAGAALARVSRDTGVAILPLGSRLCEPRCETSRDGVLLYRDGSHLSVAGARVALAPFGNAIFGR